MVEYVYKGGKKLMYCHKCGLKIDEQDNYCKHCGVLVPKFKEEKIILAEEQIEKKKYSGHAIAGFVLSILGMSSFGLICGILGIIFSSFGIRETASKELRGKGLSIAGLVVSIVAVLYNIAMIVVALVLKGQYLEYFMEFGF